MERIGPDKRAIEFAVPVLLGVPGYLVCGGAHVCMDGHMQHPPYGLWHYLADFWWVAMFLCATVAVRRTDLKRRNVLAVGLALLVLFRLVLGSAGGSLIILEIPFAIYVTVVASKTIRHRRRTARSERVASQAPP